MPNFGDYKPAEHLRVLAVGHPGSGKSSAIAAFATKEEPMYVFDVDHRLEGIGGSADWLGDNFKYIDYDEYDTRDGFKSIEQQFQMFYNAYEKRDFKYKHIVIDSIASLSEMFYLDSLKQKGVTPAKDLSKLSSAEKKGLKIIGNVAFPTPDDYHYSKRAFHILFYNYFTAFPKCNIFLSGWTTDRWGKDPNATNEYAPEILLSGKKLLATNKIAGEVPGYFGEVWEFDKEETGGAHNPVKFSVRFKSYIAKTTIPALNKAGKVDITEKNFKQEFDKILQNGKPKA